ncbi:MAG TPA: glucuronate isomerase [Bryobacteraceae bacterium]|nr:glucuronate isomerase [Bryobacteraceae bacterium]
MSLIHDDFLLQTAAARELYHDYAKNEPILDYHCHLPPQDVASNRRFRNLHEIWLEGDHYKWRAMRANGIPEELITGSASPYEKFQAWARTVPYTLRNPLYHWTHLELLRYFDIGDTLNEDTAESIWNRANERLATDELSAKGILGKFQVRALCTTDDPADSLDEHKQIAASGLRTKVLPAYRPDKALAVHDPAAFNAWIERLQSASGLAVTSFSTFLDALANRHEFFHSMGSRLSDHGLNTAFSEPCTHEDAASIFDRAHNGQAADSAEHAQFGSFLMHFFGRLDAAKGWTKQLHVGARRANNTRMFGKVGPDTGFDSIGDWPQIDAVARYMDQLELAGALPKMILYNLNPADNYAFATVIGNFQDGSIPGKIQFGSGWWFLDQKEAMEWQINALSNCGLLSRFVGMLTDSRSFLSYPRHEYFRRTLCNLLGRDIENGELPRDMPLVGGMVRNICYSNAERYFGLPL